jgi:phosphoribosylamine--glycine ligase / phosphoribosylformylglycinamidine cyclo-ligase
MPSTKVLIIGSGGREHAIAWKITQSAGVDQLYCAPGNPGTAQLGKNIPITPDDWYGLIDFTLNNRIGLVIIGPEAPMADGLTDRFIEAGVPVFAPSRLAAQIETSKVFAKNFMQRHHIPTARYAVFQDYYEALEHLSRVDYPVVIKASGLAAGKGVVVPESLDEAKSALRSILLEKEFGSAGDEVLIEERLYGEEVSILAFTDGKVVRPMLPAQDHKRLLDNDRGPNTGGMGAFSPVPSCPPGMVSEVVHTVLQPTIEGLTADGMPFVGVLYAGMMKTKDGLRVLEFNCRFGDPEAQAILPLLNTDLFEIMQACVEGKLDSMDIHWKQGYSACVVVASEGYPGKLSTGLVIEGLEMPVENAAESRVFVFHAGTAEKACEDGLVHVVNSGGRVLGVTGTGSTLQEALDAAYDRIDQIYFKGMQFRRDIAHHVLKTGSTIQPGCNESLDQKHLAYDEAGVSIDAGNRAVNLMRSAVRSTYTPQVLAGIGAFGGLYDASFLKQMNNPVLVASTDGVGTKVKLASQAGRYQSIGKDIVNHCANDILVQGAVPLFFLDYFATSHLTPEIVAGVVEGIAEACCELGGCVLIGGETAEMPGVYQVNEFDVAGTIIGVVERERILPRTDLASGDLLIGLRSSGPHTNGYSLIRKVFEAVPLDTVYPEIGLSLTDVLLEPHRSYLPVLRRALDDPRRLVKALAHLTGGGFIENIPRVLPDNLGVVIYRDRWQVPPLFKVIQKHGNVQNEEMYRIFNMGIGMVVVVSKEDAPLLREMIDEETWIIGELVTGEKKVVLV